MVTIMEEPDESMKKEPTGEEVKRKVISYLQHVISAIHKVVGEDDTTATSLSPEGLLNEIARKLLHAFEPTVLTAPLPQVLLDHPDSAAGDDDSDDDDDDEDNLIKDTPIPRKPRRLDYLRSIIRGMAPIAIDVAACFSVDNTQEKSLILLLSVWLPLAPHLTPMASTLLSSCTTNPFDVQNGDETHEWYLLEAIHALSRHYAHRQEHGTLKQFWSWAPLFSSLKEHDGMDLDDDDKHTDWTPPHATRWHAARAVGYLLDMSPGTMGTFLKRHAVDGEMVPWMLHPWMLHDEEFHWEQQHLKGAVGLLHSDETIPLPTALHVRRVLPLSSGLVHVGQGLVFPRVAATDEISSMIITATAERNLALLGTALALERHPPILLCGPPGSGKSSLVRHLHKSLGVSLLELHVDDDTDSKTLIGSYTTTDIPGEFTWQAGALTRAVREGQWVLLEDLDTVPLEIQAALVPLLEDRRLPLGTAGATEICHANFRLFATLSTSSRRNRSNHNIFNSRLWTRVRVDSLPQEEWNEIARRTYSNMPVTISNAALSILEAALKEKTAGRPAAVRDFLKLLSRISNSVTFDDADATYATEAQRTLCLAETLDIFAAHNPDFDYIRDFAARVAAPAWNLTADVALEYLQTRRPEVLRSELVTQIGRASLQHHQSSDDSMDVDTSFAPTNTALRLMESIAVCVRENEPLLLVGETGCGKTTVVQQLAQMTDRTLMVQNLSLQTDSTDLLGGYRPLEISQIARTIYLEFVDIFVSTFSRKQNADFLNFASSVFQKNQWKKLSQCFRRAAKLGLDKIKKADNKAKLASLESWEAFADSSERFERQRVVCDTKLAFAFTEGALVGAIRTGKWVLLDEINLASSETLQRLCGLLDDSSGSVTLTERGDAVAIKRHPDFRLFAAMNPATDAGKKDLPASIRSRFTELYVDELKDPVELRTVAARYLKDVVSSTTGPVEHSLTVVNAVETYLKCRDLALKSLVDAGGQRPRYTLRTMCRALTASRNLVVHQKFSLMRGIMEGFELAFEGPLEETSLNTLKTLLKAKLGQEISKDEMSRPGRRPGGRGSENDYLLIKPYWIDKGPLDPQDWSEKTSSGRARFILTTSMSVNLKRISRAVAAGPWPVLLEGPTSAGKTTLVEYLAARCGHKVVRINNHEHTDVQEYTGAYASDENGSLTFRDGILVQALRKGHWVILDELNLAPSEVLEALNRLLDDNRELYLAEVNETVKPHPSFRLFATQNPSGAYGGRKPLSRAFRNRFVEIHMGDIPTNDMVTILEKRSGCPSTHAKLLVKVMTSLRQRRSRTGVFQGKDGLITPRDLLRWAERRVSSKEELAEEGFMLLGERLRSAEERDVVREEIDKHFKTKICCDQMYYGEASLARRTLEQARGLKTMDIPIESVAPTKTILRLLSIVLRCIKQKEPVLLVGDTGCGKTTVIQLLSTILQRHLKVVNCHATTETSDLIGGLRPVRGRKKLLEEMCALFLDLTRNVPDDKLCVDGLPDILLFLSSRKDADLIPDEVGAKIINMTREIWKLHTEAEECSDLETGQVAKKRKLEGGCVQSKCRDANLDMCQVGELVGNIEKLNRSYVSLFEWVDGSLVTSMKRGDLFLLDEMSLAEDAVLERLNSVLEPSRTIVLAEKGDDGSGDESHVVKGHENFLIFATMNPGGDFGKRELSPALRSRFTEVWVPNAVDLDDIKMVLDSTFSTTLIRMEVEVVKQQILEYTRWFNATVCGDASSPCASLSLSLRDIIAWARFVIEVSSSNEGMTVWEAFCHGTSLMHLDGLGLGTGLSLHDARSTKKRCLDFLLGCVPEEYQFVCHNSILEMELKPVATLNRFGIQPFSIPYGPQVRCNLSFNFSAPTTGSNLLRVLRAMQLSKPVLLEGSPGVGKTSLISALAKASGHNLVRINLSEQTDIADLMGSDLPLPDGDNPEDAQGSAFKWCDGVLLSAIKRGDWVLLDELNLATQSVLEGLNSCLDHRASVFIPELGESFECPLGFRVFAAQNPLGQGGGRKGLPKSFLNRFTKVYVEALENEDLQMIIGSRFPHITESVRTAMVGFNGAIQTSVVTRREYGEAGSPWEFNLRDVFRWCELVATCESQDILSFGSCARDLYLQRFRTSGDRVALSKQFAHFFDSDSISLAPGDCSVSATTLMVGATSLKRSPVNDIANPQIGIDRALLRSLFLPMEAVSRCVTMNWPCLLIGQRGSGKTTILRCLASILNVKLVDVCLTPSTDVNELIGSFEQVDSLQNEKQLVLMLEASVRRLCSSIGKCRDEAELANDAYSKYESISEVVSKDNFSTSKKRMVSLATDLLDLLLTSKVKNADCVRQAEVLLRRVIESEKTADLGGRFRWVDGILVDAMIKGYWIHLENVNLCSSSVLDRLNPVMEPSGELLMTETGTQEGGPSHRSITPHRDFRLFLSMCPERGEVSRAMRNRCVEVCLLDQGDNSWVDDQGTMFTEQTTVDQIDSMSRNGLRSIDLATSLLRVHQSAVEESVERGASRPNVGGPCSIAMGLRGLRSRGTGFYPAFKTLIQLEYDAPDDQDLMITNSSEIATKMPMTPCIREGWSLNPALASAALDTRLIQLLSSGLPAWPKRFRSQQESQVEGILNGVCPVVPDVDKNVDTRVKCLVFQLLAALVRGAGLHLQTRFCDTFDTRTSRILHFIAKKLTSFDRAVVPLFVDRLAHLALEQETQKHLETSEEIHMHTRNAYVYDVSFWLHTGKVDRSAVSCPVTPAVFPLFQAANEWSAGLEEMILKANGGAELAATKRLRKFLGVRDQLWLFFKTTKYVQSDSSSFLSFDDTRFIVQWVWFKKGLAAIDDFFVGVDGPLATQRQKLDAFIANIDRVLLDGDGIMDLSGDLLWKKGGHPLLPASAASWKAIMDINETCEALSITSDRRFDSLTRFEMDRLDLDELIKLQHPVLFLAHSHRQELLEALCMSYWSSTDELNGQSAPGESHRGDYHAVCERVVQKKAAFAANWKATQVDTTIATVENLMDVEALEQLQVVLDEETIGSVTKLPFELLKTFADIQIAPIVEFWLIHEERRLLGQVASLLVSIAPGKNAGDRLPALIRRFVQVALSSSVWQVADLRPFQTLVWALELPSSGDSLRHLVQCLLPTMLHNASDHMWKNTFNDLDIISARLEYPNQWSDPSGPRRDSSENWGVSFGPTRLSEHARTDTVLKLVGSEFSAALFGPKKAHYLTLENHEARDYQTKQLVSQLSTFVVIPSTSDFPTELLYLFLNVIESLEQYFPAEALASLRSLFIQQTRTHSPEGLDEMLELLEQCKHVRFKECYHSVVKPLVGCLAKNDRASLWIFVGLLRVHLLVPQSPLDPGQKPAAKVKELDRRLWEVRDTIAAYRLDSGIRSGEFSPTEEILSQWVSEANVLVRKKTSQEKKLVERDSQSPKFVDLFREIRGFWKAAVTPPIVAGIVDNLQSGSQQSGGLRVAFRREESWQITAASFCARLSQHYGAYRDVITPFVVAVRCVQRGLREMRDRCAASLSRQTVSAYNCIGNLIQFPFATTNSHLTNHANAMKLMGLSKRDHSELVRKCSLALSLSALSRFGLKKRARGHLFSNDQTACLSLFTEIIKSWLKLVDGLSTRDSTDDEEQERLYREQFPDHNKEFASFVESQEEEDLSDEEMTEEAPISTISQMNLTDDHISILYELYQELFLPKSTWSMDVSRLRSFQLSYAGAHLLKNVVPDECTGRGLNEEIGAHCLAVSLSSGGRAFIGNAFAASTGYSFHRDPNPSEVRRASKPLQNLLSRTSKLLTAFPGHEILIALGQVSEYVQKLELTSTSVGKAMTGLEVVLRKAQEWEQHASDRVKLGPCLFEISQLVSAWRKLELSSWASLLSAREERFIKRARRHWMRLFNVLTDGPSEPEISGAKGLDAMSVSAPSWVWKGAHRRKTSNPNMALTEDQLDDLTKLLDTFVLTSCIGEFGERLGLIGALSNQFSDRRDISGVAIFRLLSSVKSYYSQFLHFVSCRQESLRRPLEAKLKDEVKLAKWDEQSYYRLVDSTERNHRKLMKHLREYDDILEISIGSLLQHQYDDGIRSIDSVGTEGCNKVPGNRELFPIIENCGEEVLVGKLLRYSSAGERSWVSKESIGVQCDDYVRRLFHFHKKMSVIVAEEVNDAQSWSQVGTSETSDFCSTIFDRIESLRKEKTTRPMKQRAVTDLFKKLKQNGFKSTKWAVPAQMRQMKHVFQLPLPSSSSSMLTAPIMSELKKAMSYCERTVTEVQRLRSEVAILGSRHMTMREMQLMSHFSDHGLFLIFQQRTLAVESLGEVAKLEALLQNLRSTSSGLPTGQKGVSEKLGGFHDAWACSKECVAQLRLFVATILQSAKTDEVGRILRDALAVFDDCLVSMNDYAPKDPSSVVTSETLTGVNAMNDALDGIQEKLRGIEFRCCRENSCLPLDVFTTCQDSISAALDRGRDCLLCPKYISGPPGDAVIKEFLVSASASIQSGLLSAQKVHKARAEWDIKCAEEGDNHDALSIWESHKRACQEWDCLNVRGLAAEVRKMTKALLLIHDYEDLPGSQRDWFVSVAGETVALLQQVLQLTRSRVEDGIFFFCSTAKLQYVLARVFRTLVSKGYCADNQSEEDAEGDGGGDISGMKFEDDVEGTGMGEGDGKQDVTDQLESEEQLLGLKDENEGQQAEENKQNEKLDEEEAKQGMEMEADFDGDMFDVPEDNNEEERDENESEEEELDREMGDGLDENEDVVDEKMWGDSDDEDEINHEEEKFEKDSKTKGESVEDEMRTKEEGEEGSKGDGKEEGTEEAEAQSRDTEEKPAIDEDNQEPEINEDKEENYEDKQGVEVRNEEEAPVDDEAGEMDLDENLNLNEEDGGEDNDDDLEDNAKEDENMDEEEGDQTAEAATEPQNPDDKNDESEEEATEAGPVHDGATGEQVEDEDEENSEEEPDGPRINQAPAENSHEEAFGVKSKDGADNIKEHVNEDDEQGVDEEGGQGEDDNGAGEDETPQDPSAGAGGNEGSGGQREEGHGTDGATAPQTEAPNPFKDPGNAAKFWHKKLSMIEREKDHQEGPETSVEEDKSVSDTNKDGEFEYAAENETSETQVLAEATEESKMDFHEDQQDAEEDSKSDEEATKSKEEEIQTGEQKSARKGSKPTPSTKPLSDEPDDEDNHAEEDTKNDDAVEGKEETVEEDETMEGDEEDCVESRGNQVVSDLAQVHIDDDDDDTSIIGNIVEEEQISGISSEEAAESRKRWNQVASETHNLSRRLCEKLRLVMEPLLTTKLKGDYRTGKRINMKKVIGFIASGYRKDKIWLRRTKPAKRNYRVLLAVDNSESMDKSGAGDMALAAMATLATGMSQLEIGELGVASFGDEMRLLHPFHLPFTSESGAGIFHNFPFDEKRTRTALCVESALTAMDMPGDHAALQLMFLISDGRIERDSRSSLRRLMREMVERNILLVMIIVEGKPDGDGKKKRKDSIVHMKEVTFENGKPKVKQFIEDYPFPYYIILEDMQTLPEVLGDALRQWFEMIAQLQQTSR